MRRTWTVVVAMLLVLGSADAWAQATAQISGTVRDETGAALPGVDITATQTDTGVARTAVTNETGSFVLVNLPLGPYRLEASLSGFRTFAQTGIVLQVNSSPVVNPVLSIGQLEDAITVQGNAALVETRSTAVGQVVDNERILELPLNGRNVTELIVLAGVATPGNAGGVATGSANPFNRSGSVSIAGGLASGVNFNLDGANHNNPGNNLEMPMPFPDALQEFKVETSALSAQSGMHPAGAVSAVTKAGTNELHGTFFEFVRHNIFNARNFFATSKDSLLRNQFGGTLGGPIVQSKLFFFGAYQGTIVRQDPNSNISNVPTAAMLAGDFTAVASPACNGGRQIALRAPFVNNRIDPARLSPAAVALAAKLPQTTDPCGRVTWGSRNIEDNHQVVGKIDYQLDASHSIFGRYMASTVVVPEPYGLTGSLLASGTGIDALAQSLTLGDTYVFGSNAVNSFRVVVNRNAGHRSGPACCSFADLGVRMYDYGQDSGIISVSGAFNVGGNTASDGKTVVDVFSLNDDFSLVRGNHQSTFGMSVAFSKYAYDSQSFSRGQLNFNGQLTGLGISDFLTGNLFSWLQAPPNAQIARQRYLAAFAQDTWRVSPTVTLNAGLRWEPFLPVQRLDNGVSHFDIDAYRAGIRTTQFVNAPPGLFYPGDPGFPERSGMYRKWNNFSPRLGVAWNPDGEGRLAVRASYGLFYDFPPIQFFINQNIAPPWTPKIEVRNVSFDDPWRTFPGGNPFPLAVDSNAPFTAGGVFTSMRYDTNNPMVQQWSLALERQIGAAWLVSATYLGNNTSHLWTAQALNPAVYMPGASCRINGVTYTPCSSTANTNERRVLSLENPTLGALFGNVSYIDDGGTANYHGLLLSMERRSVNGIGFSANYTWSHCISDPYQVSISSGTGNNTYTDPTNRSADRGNCTTSATDRRHVFNLTAVAETPSFASRPLNAVAGSWRIAPIFRVQSGSFLTVTTTSDIALNGIGSQRLNQVLPDVYGNGSVQNFLNPAAFALPATGTRGNMGVASVLGPGFWQLDVALSKGFRIREGHRIELRAEVFNVPNATRLGNPVVNFNAGNFGQIITAADPRIMQFAVKYLF